VLGRLPEVGEAAIGESLALEGAQLLFGKVGERALLDLELGVDQVLDLREEPAVDPREAVDVLERHAHAEGIGHVPEALGARVGELVLDFSMSTVFRLKPSTPTSSPRRAFCSDSWKLRPIAITSPTLFIWWSGDRRPAGISRRRSAGPS
jgi:hypothetical protein